MTEASRNNTGDSSSAPVSAFESFVSEHFVQLLVGIAAVGGALAFLVPWLLYIAGITGEADTNLRLHILYVTGGIIAVLGLVETRHKNTTDRAKALSEQARQFNETIAKEREKIEADKAKNEQNHIRQVHAERRSRYIAAIEQLSNRENATTRLGGVYALISLIDEWLADGALLTDKERRKEGQAINNSLCAYIRSPFLLAERAERLDKPYAKDLQKDFGGNKEKFEADKQIFKKHKATLEEERQVRQSIIKEIRERLHDFSAPGSWSKYDYDFSNAHFFYHTDFSNSIFGAFASFYRATFSGYAEFYRTKFTQIASFYGAKFTRSANFCKAKFTQLASFNKATFDLAFDTFAETFGLAANFFGATFSGYTDFHGTKFNQKADFCGTKFNQKADFNEATFEHNPQFITIASWDGAYKTRFSCKVYPEDYKFEVSHNSPYKIETEEQEHNGVKFIIPKGTELFEPRRTFRAEVP